MRCLGLREAFEGAGADYYVNLQGYEVTEDEVRISLDSFKARYSDALGYPEYVRRAPLGYLFSYLQVSLIA